MVRYNRVVLEWSQSEGNNPENGDATATDTDHHRNHHHHHHRHHYRHCNHHHRIMNSSIIDIMG